MAPGIVNKIRMNHALEHATISVLLKGPGVGIPLAGYATPGGFYIYGNLPTEKVALAVDEALERLKGGERELAVSRYCGTNLVVAALMVGLAMAITLGGKRRLRDLPSAFGASLLALFASRPVGQLMQRYYTTLADMQGLEVEGISRWGISGGTFHRVRTRINS